MSASINRRVECGVVVHLELAVQLETTSSREDFVPEDIEAVNKIGTLFFEDRETGAVSLEVVRRGVGPLGFFASVVDLQAKNRETIDDETRGFGMERGRIALELSRREPIHEGAVELFGEVIANLVGAVNAALDVSELGIAGAWRASFVFRVPKLEVSTMLAAHKREELIGLGIRFFFRVVPALSELVVEAYDGVG